MHSTWLRKPVGIAVVMLITLLAVSLDSVKKLPTDCSAGKPYCYETPVHLDSTINTPGFEGKPSLSADGLELYFVSDRPGALGGAGDQDIYVSRRRSVNSNWGEPERVPPPVSSAFFDITPTISLDGLALYFGSNRPGPFSPPWPDLWVSYRASVNHPWGEAVHLGPGINTPLFEGSIDISPDQRTAFFAGVTPDFVFDIFVSTRSSIDEPFGPRVILGEPINSEGHDYGPALTPDGHTMFFSSGTDNPFAPGAINHLYVSERKNDRGSWGPRIYLDTLNCPKRQDRRVTISWHKVPSRGRQTQTNRHDAGYELRATGTSCVRDWRRPRRRRTGRRWWT
jgi:WD40-like Beta Propeller Repeat